MVIAWLSLREQRKLGLTGMPALPALVSCERALIREMRPALAKLLPHWRPRLTFSLTWRNHPYAYRAETIMRK